MLDTPEAVARFSPISLRRHGRRPLRFEGALIVRSGPGGAADIALYETSDGGVAVSIALSDRFADAWRVPGLDEAVRLIAGFDARDHAGLDTLLDGDPMAAAAALRSRLALADADFAAAVGALIRTGERPRPWS